jgi:site-specific recombinase XerC
MRVVKGFSRWLWRDGRVREDALAHLTSLNPDADRRHERRALTPVEQARLIRAAEAGPAVIKLSGPDRAALYRLALGTGFRANELRSLTPEAFQLGADILTVTVAAAYSKRRRDDVQPIRPDLADALRPWLSTKLPGKHVFGNQTGHTSLMIRTDLEAAGIAYRDGSDRVADFHSLRHSFITALAMCKAPVKVIQSLARHSTPALTLGVYAHVGLFDQTSALDALQYCPGSAGQRSSRNRICRSRPALMVLSHFLWFGMTRRRACRRRTSSAARGRASIAYFGRSARFLASRSRSNWLRRSRSRRIGMISSRLADPLATRPIRLNMDLLGR